MEYATWRLIGRPWIVDGLICGGCRDPARQRRYDVALAEQRLRRYSANPAATLAHVAKLREDLRRADEALDDERRATVVGKGVGDLVAARRAAYAAESWARETILRRKMYA